MPGLAIYCFDRSPLFFNANHFADDPTSRIENAEQPLKSVLVDMEAGALIDTTAMGMLIGLHEALRANKVKLGFANVRDRRRDLMIRAEVEDTVGSDNFYIDVHSSVEAFAGAEGLQFS